MKGFQVTINNDFDYCIYFDSTHYDNYFVDEQNILIVVEGVILNQPKINKKSFHDLYKQFGKDFSAQLEGEFVGFIFDRNLNLFYSFTNYTATRKLFYYHYNNQFVVDTSLIRLVNYLKNNQFSFSLDVDTMYQLLTSGNTLENYTPIKEVKKLCDAEQLEFNLNNRTLKLDSYNKILEDFNGSKKEALHQINQLFTDAIDLEFKRDEALNKEKFAFLSGGLDSRMTVLTAKKQGYQIDEAFCFSQKDYWDETIAKSIAEDYNIPFHFVPLNGGNYITKIDEIFKISEGLGIYSGCLHTNYAYQFITKNKFGLLHSGQLGDGILGGFNRFPYKHAPTKEKIIVHERLFSRIENNFNSLIKNYDREELFLTRNVGYNRTVLGSYLAEDISYQVSPFMYSKFIQFAQSLPEKWKYKQAIYIDWINAFHKEATDYRWERTLLKPKSNLHTIIGDKIVKRLYNISLNKILKQEAKGKMTAYNYYYLRNNLLREEMDLYFDTYIEQVPNIDLKVDLIYQYKEGNFTEKSAVLTVLSVVKHYF